jgi:hypothetical protein
VAAGQRGERAIGVLGSVLLVAYVVQGVGQLEWPWLAHLQSDERYKFASGCGVAAYLWFQWTLGARRHFAPVSAVRWHKLAGALAPLVLYVHALRFAYGYLVLLAVAYLGTASFGLLHRPVLNARARWLFTWWFLIHVASSAILVVLGGYHVVIALAYE